MAGVFMTVLIGLRKYFQVASTDQERLPEKQTGLSHRQNLAGIQQQNGSGNQQPRQAGFQ